MSLSKEDKQTLKLALGTAIVGSATAFLFTRYKTSKSNEWLVKTGLLVEDMQIGKKFFQLPFQNIQRIVVTPQNYNLNINSMSKEKMEFKFPIIFTLGPKTDSDSLTKYSRYMLNLEDKEAVIKGVIEGEARALAAGISIEDIFAGRTEFKNSIINHVQPQLDQYGIAIYNANIEELKDSDTSNYFKSLSLRIKAEAENKAKVQVAEQNKMGEIGSKERESETRQRVAIVESEAIIVENERQQAMLKSAAELEKLKAEQDLIMKSAQIKSQNEAEKYKMDLEKEVQAKRLQMEVEKVRAAELSKVQVNAEKAQKEAEGLANAQKLKADADLYTKTKDGEAVLNTIKLRAEADLYTKSKDAEATKLKAEADLYTKSKEADAIKFKAEADLIAKENEAKGLSAIYTAQSEGVNKLVSSFNGDTKALITYMMLDKDQFTKLADSSAKAIQGLNPKITVWNTGSSDATFDSISKLGKSIVPMLDTIKEQTGYSLPEWMVKEPTKEMK
jgi:flotillin